jgi:hypothetical protein
MADAPKADSPSFMIYGTKPFSEPAPGVLAGDTLNGATITSYGIRGRGEQKNLGVPTPTRQNGSIVLNADGSFTYTPPSGGLTVDDSFRYTITNDAGQSTAVVVLHPEVLVLFDDAGRVTQSWDGVNWTAWSQLVPATPSKPSAQFQTRAAAFLGDLYAFRCPGPGSGVSYSVGAPSTWRQETLADTPGGAQNLAPVVFNGTLHVLYTTVIHNEELHVQFAASRDGETWTFPDTAFAHATTGAVSPAVFNEQLFLCYQRCASIGSQGICIVDGTLGYDVIDQDLGATTQTVAGIKIAGFPGAVVFENTLYLFYVERSSGALSYVTSTDGAAWSSGAAIPRVNIYPQAPMNPSAVVFGGELYVFYWDAFSPQGTHMRYHNVTAATGGAIPGGGAANPSPVMSS